jgi:hypothetical protein
MVVGPDRRIYIGSLPPYGEHGGALGVYDPGEDSFVENFRHLIPDQSIVTLASDPKSGLIYGGSSNVGGGGTRPIEKDARLFAWDPSAMEKVLDVIPVEGDGSINAMAVMDGCLYFTSRPSNSMLQLESGGEYPRVVATSPGPVLDISLEPLGDRLVGLTRSGVIELDPCDLRCRTLEPYPDGINCGFATLDGNIYFGSGEKLVMYRASR